IYLATLFAGKTPVMVNWTLGSRNIQSSLDSVNVKQILTARALLTRLAAQNIDIASVEDNFSSLNSSSKMRENGIKNTKDAGVRFVCLEDIGQKLTRPEKLTALALSHLNWNRLTKITPSDTAAILFTSGSESQPKAVPLTHKNILTNIADVDHCATFTKSDSLLGILPPFHSFGLTISMLLPLTTGLPAVYYPNPTDGRTLARTIDAYKVSIMVGTPTFLNGIVRSSQPNELDSLRLVVSGAEKCPDALYKLLAQQCPQTTVLEGYGVTECSPVISVNRQNDHHPGTIGRIMNSIEHTIVHPETNEPTPTNEQGMLLVRGDSIFKGYLNPNAPSPFIQHNNKQWYKTGDLVKQDEQGIITFQGRLKRFVKRGGEMISLPAIEAVLTQHYPPTDDDTGPNLAITPGPKDNQADLILFTTLNIDRQ
ncbi:MAG: AMP-binding protein, partial [bacterium]|nr:AMP-binding protein [bacterium]